MDSLLLLFVLGSVILVIVGLLFYLHDNEGRRKAPNTAGPQCCFCGKGREQVKKLIAGPEIYICDECIDLSSDLIKRELAKNEHD